jgi:hypothetical protein
LGQEATTSGGIARIVAEETRVQPNDYINRKEEADQMQIWIKN